MFPYHPGGFLLSIYHLLFFGLQGGFIPFRPDSSCCIHLRVSKLYQQPPHMAIPSDAARGRPALPWAGKRIKKAPHTGCFLMLERVKGLEPSISAWKANVLPLHYTRMLKKGNWCGRRDSNSYTLRHRNLNPARLPIPPRPHSRRIERNLVTRRRFELRTP